jgi:hypothetical protein
MREEEVEAGGVALVPFIKTVFDMLSGNAIWHELSIGKNNLSLWTFFTFSVSNIVFAD